MRSCSITTKMQWIAGIPESHGFAPTTLTVKARAQITWTNSDDIPHTWLAATRSLSPKYSTPTRSSAFMASKPRTYAFMFDSPENDRQTGGREGGRLS